MPPLRALFVEDSEADCELLVRELRKGGYDLAYKQVCTADELNAAVGSEQWDIVISDHTMPGFSGTAALKIVRDRMQDTPFIFVSATIGEDTAVDAMRHGAHDYVMKGNLARLVPAVEREIRDADQRRNLKRTEERMRQLEKFEAIGNLAGGIAHDFNNAIGAILGWAELGIDAAPPGTPVARYLHNIRLQSRRAADLTRQLLAYARRQVLEPRVLDLNQHVAETVGLLERIIGQQIEIKMALAAVPQIIRVDPVQIEQVFMNLCLNARDAMPDGGQMLVETATVELDDEYCKHHIYAHPGKFVRLSISDTGIGIHKDSMEHIFEPFFTTKEHGKGTGLGLATALGVVRQHEGTIEVYSEVGKGTVFHVYLPAIQKKLDLLDRQDDSAIRGGAETILIAEDNDSIRTMVQESLESLGYKVILAQDGLEALEIFRASEENISIVLMDVIMSRMSGAEAYAEIAKIEPGMPVIFMSGYSQNGPALATTLPNNTVLLQKPFSPKTMARKVRAILDAAKH
jgi:two-component system, cell cycle sensor histidine kinase and response regulator CckA